MVEESSTTVEIFGREYKIKSVADEGYIQRVAEFVDGKMKEVSQGSSFPAQDRLAIMAAVNIADELFQQKERSASVFSEIEQKTDKLIDVLDQNLHAGG